MALLVPTLAEMKFLLSLDLRIFTAFLVIWVVVGKHGLIFALSVWAGTTTLLYFVNLFLREGRPGAKLGTNN